jgi:hypothetical protein
MGTKARQLAERNGVPGFAVQIRSDRIALLVRVSEKSGYVPATYSLSQNYPRSFKSPLQGAENPGVTFEIAEALKSIENEGLCMSSRSARNPNIAAPATLVGKYRFVFRVKKTV